MSDRALDICGVRLDLLSEKEVLDVCDKSLKEGSFLQIATVNPEFILEAQENKEFRELLNKTDINVVDGIGLLWASRYLAIRSYGALIDWFLIWITGLSLIFYPKYCRKYIKDTLTGVDLVKALAVSEIPEIRLFLLGGMNEVPFKAARELVRLNPALKIVACCNRHRDETEAILEQIRASRANVLLVGFGAPFQDLWIEKHKAELPNVKVAIGVGGTFDYLSGNFKRAPRWMRKIGLDWFYRLITQPWNLKKVHGSSSLKRIKRIYNATWRFVHVVWRFKYDKKASSPECSALEA